MAGWSSTTGAALRGEVGARIGQHVAAFVYGQWRPAETSAGAGIRVTW